MNDKLELVQFETTSACPARCVFCPHKDQVRPHGMMSMALIHKIIDEAYGYGVREVMPFLNGEPFADPRLFEILDYIKTKPGLKVGIYTNIHLATLGKLNVILEYADILSYFEISWNGITEEKRKAITGLPDFDKDMEKVQWFLGKVEGLGNPFKVTVGMVGMPEYRKDFPEFKKLFGKYAQCYRYFNWAGKIGDKYERPRDMTCNRILHHMTILHDGTVALCCMDNEGSMPLGNIKNDSIGSIWEEFIPMRTAHKQGYFMNLCKVCNMEG